MLKYDKINHIVRRTDALKSRIRLLSSLQKIVNLPPDHDITIRQWHAINEQLKKIESRLLLKLEQKERQYKFGLHVPETLQKMNAHLANIELESVKAFNFFDTMFDIITQRSVIGRLLAGCEVIAYDAIRIKHPALTVLESPIIFCDRGYGASILRQGIKLPYNVKNPVPLIQIPYSRLKTKYDLISIIHEAGHEITNQLKLDRYLVPHIKTNLRNANTDSIVAELFSLGLPEIIPDLCALLKCGFSHVTSLRDILSVPPEYVFTISRTDPHPTPYIRVLLAFENCRRIWGKGIWDELEKEWIDLYPLRSMANNAELIIKNMIKNLPLLSKTLLETRLESLNGNRIPDLFDLSCVSPTIIQQATRSLETGTLNLRGLKPCTQLAVFRVIGDEGRLSEVNLNKLMTKWLVRLGEMRDSHTPPIFAT